MKEWVKDVVENTECKDDDEIFLELVNKFDFGYGSYMESVVVAALGSVLADLPQDVFTKLLEIKNIYIRPGGYGSCVLSLELNRDLKKGEIVKILQIAEDELFGDSLELRGIIAHEFAHLFQGDIIGSREKEKEADEMAISWGFEQEIKFLRDGKR